MFSEEDLQSAVAAGVMDAGTAQAFRDHVSARPAIPAMADEENIRLVTGFNDIFVTIACLLVIFSGVYVGGGDRLWIGGLVVAVVSWLMAEIFTRKRRMALPSIVVLVAFVGGLGMFVSGLAMLALPEHPVTESYTYQGHVNSWTHYERWPWQISLIAAAGAVASMIGAIAHWKRFRVPITVAAGTAALALLLLALLAWATGLELKTNPVLAPAALVCGIAVFAFAMRWDLSDRTRVTQRADIAFWLHLLAAPLIAHPLFYWLHVLDYTNLSTLNAVGVLTIYALFALIALIVDRRALLVSALLYVLVALNSVLQHLHGIEMNLAISTLAIGCTLLALSILWAPLRRIVLKPLPASWRDRLPPAG
ncbi:hypothetical protein [Novosphingobium sp. 9]|uniref:hypothetical protein n=1 Tax=Novosphingobium sp. 9 TaxID=2025349 RepID=UPI0021B69C92|nr:hypothetical protein [Novosphingobium sp. 9]